MRPLTALALCVALPSMAGAQSAFLAETELRDSCFANELTMKLTGTVRVQQTGKSVSFPRSAEATHHFLERILDIKDGQAERTARFYNRADVVLADGAEKFPMSLKGNHALLVAHRLKEQLVIYHPLEALTREEMEVTSHFDTLALPGLLPRRQVKIGETWAVPRDVVQSIADLDAVEKAEVKGTFEKIDGDFAHLTFAGLVQGIDMAAPVTILVKDARAIYNLKLKRLTQVDWRVSDERQQGPVSPALSADVVYSLKRVPTQTPTQLGDIALVRVPAGPPPAALTILTYRNLRKNFSFQFGRDWHVVSQTSDGKLVLRLIDSRGEFLAQATVVPWQKVDAAQRMSLADFAKTMRESSGWEQKEGPPLDETENLKSPHGYSIFRVTAEGKQQGLAVLRSFYLVATPDGDRLLFDFTMLPVLASKLDGRDLTLVQSTQFLTMENRIEATPASRPAD